MKLAAAPRFDTLPLEVQQKIIAFTSFRTVLNITLVNHALHTACENRAVFKDLIDNRNGHGGTVWRPLHLSSQTELETWKRYACADDLASNHWVERRLDSSWFPQLIALNRMHMS